MRRAGCCEEAVGLGGFAVALFASEALGDVVSYFLTGDLLRSLVGVAISGCLLPRFAAAAGFAAAAEGARMDWRGVAAIRRISPLINTDGHCSGLVL